MSIVRGWGKRHWRLRIHTLCGPMAYQFPSPICGPTCQIILPSHHHPQLRRPQLQKTTSYFERAHDPPPSVVAHSGTHPVTNDAFVPCDVSFRTTARGASWIFRPVRHLPLGARKLWLRYARKGELLPGPPCNMNRQSSTNHIVSRVPTRRASH